MPFHNHIASNNKHFLRPKTMVTKISECVTRDGDEGRGGLEFRSGLKPCPTNISHINVGFKNSLYVPPKPLPLLAPKPKHFIHKLGSPKAKKDISSVLASPSQRRKPNHPQQNPMVVIVCPRETQISQRIPQIKTPNVHSQKTTPSQITPKAKVSHSNFMGPQAFSSSSPSHRFQIASVIDDKMEKLTLATNTKDSTHRGKLQILARKSRKNACVVPDVSLTPALLSIVTEPQRCKFITPQTDPLYVKYHDEEWGVPVHDDRRLFELLVLAGAQVELNWTTILHKRDAYRDAFCGYDPSIVASFTEKDIQMFEADKSLLLLTGKIRGIVNNARQIQQIVREFGSFDKYVWAFMGYKPSGKSYRDPVQVPRRTPKSECVSKDLVKRGFRFVGPSIVYSFMQSSGMVNDHLTQCFRHHACRSLSPFT